jgi:hypothetical protein
VRASLLLLPIRPAQKGSRGHAGATALRNNREKLLGPSHSSGPTAHRHGWTHTSVTKQRAAAPLLDPTTARASESETASPCFSLRIRLINFPLNPGLSNGAAPRVLLCQAVSGPGVCASRVRNPSGRFGRVARQPSQQLVSYRLPTDHALRKQPNTQALFAVRTWIVPLNFLESLLGALSLKVSPTVEGP